jgi:hypothetical protein
LAMVARLCGQCQSLRGHRPAPQPGDALRLVRKIEDSRPTCAAAVVRRSRRCGRRRSPCSRPCLTPPPKRGGAGHGPPVVGLWGRTGSSGANKGSSRLRAPYLATSAPSRSEGAQIRKPGGPGAEDVDREGSPADYYVREAAAASDVSRVSGPPSDNVRHDGVVRNCRRQ